MIVDASAILAILLEEPERDAMEDALAIDARGHEISPVNYLEAAVRVDRWPAPGKSAQLDPLMAELGIRITTVTPEQATLARAAYQKFGRGNHPARLNLGDCFAYALAKARNEPLLFKGDDFRLTDVEAAI